MKTLKQIVEAYNQITNEDFRLLTDQTLHHTLPEEEYKAIVAANHKKQVELAKEGKQLYNNKVEIINADKIIGARVEYTRSGSKIIGMDCNTLTKIKLDLAEEGYVYAPYNITFDGVAESAEQMIAYKIKRENGKVYLLWTPQIKY